MKRATWHFYNGSIKGVVTPADQLRAGDIFYEGDGVPVKVLAVGKHVEPTFITYDDRIIEQRLSVTTLLIQDDKGEKTIRREFSGREFLRKSR